MLVSKSLLPLAFATLIAFSSLPSATAQCPFASAQEWLPWVSQVDLNEEANYAAITAADGVKQLKSTELWSGAGEKLVLQLATAEVMDDVIQQYKSVADAAKNDPAQHSTHLAKLGMLYASQSYLGESESAVTKLATQADKLFDQAAEADSTSWHAWMGKATLYGYSQDKDYAKAALQILEPLAESIQDYAQDNPQYAYTYQVLADVHDFLGDKSAASAARATGKKLFRKHVAFAKHK